MAYLDNWDVRTKPQWWTAAIYRNLPGRGYVFQGYMPARSTKWADFLQYRMDNYSLTRGYATYPFYWDTLGKVWMRDSGRPAVSGDLDVGAIERRNPLPPGRYWQDIIGTKQARAWDLWAQPKLKDGSVVIEKWEHFRADPLSGGGWVADVNKGAIGDFLIPDFLVSQSPQNIPVRNWMLFTVKRPVEWPQTELGFPTIAGPEIQQSKDTAQVPEVPTILEELGDDIKNKVIVPVVAGFAVYLGLKIFLELRK